MANSKGTDRIESIEVDAERLEALLPRLMRVLLPSVEEDPLGGLPLGQIRLMRAVAPGPKLAADAGAELGLSPSALSQMVQRLEEAGLIRREEFPEDKRHRSLCLTEAGAARMADRRRLRAHRARSLLDRLSADERSTLLCLLERLVTEDVVVEPISAAAEVAKGSPF